MYRTRYSRQIIAAAETATRWLFAPIPLLRRPTAMMEPRSPCFEFFKVCIDSKAFKLVFLIVVLLGVTFQALWNPVENREGYQPTISRSSMRIRNEATCSNHIGEKGEIQCLQSHLNIFFSPRISDTILEEALQRDDDDYLIRQVHISFFCDEDSSGSLNKFVSSAVDKFLTSRPWWLVMEESFSEPPVTKPTNAGILQRCYHVYLLRHAQQVEPLLRFLAGIQYPPQSVCEKTSLQVAHMVNSGWGSHLTMYGMIMGAHPWQIFEVYDSNSNLPSETVAYSTGSTCPSIVNKRRCAFLALTNCTLPKYLTRAPPKDFSRNPEKYWAGSFALYDSAAVGARRIPGWPQQAGPPNEPQNEYHKGLYQAYWVKARQWDWYRVQSNRFVDGSTVELNSSRQGKHRPYMHEIIPSYAFLQRLSALYRRLVFKRIEKFRQSQVFPANMPCTAIHIRRGDRVIAGLNVTDYCADHQRFADSSDCVDRHGKPIDCGDASDLGCWSARPFASLRLQDYLDRAWKLQQVLQMSSSAA